MSQLTRDGAKNLGMSNTFLTLQILSLKVFVSPSMHNQFSRPQGHGKKWCSICNHKKKSNSSWSFQLPMDGTKRRASVTTKTLENAAMR